MKVAKRCPSLIIIKKLINSIKKKKQFFHQINQGVDGRFSSIESSCHQKNLFFFKTNYDLYLHIINVFYNFFTIYII